MATHDTKKMTATRAFAEQDRADQSKYSTEYLRSHMSTGGGEPIPKGEKWTHEKRTLQPRDPDTGQFGWNSDAGLNRKYPRGESRAKGIPLSVRRLNFNNGVLKAGDVINIGGRTFVAPRDMTSGEVVSLLKTVVKGDDAAVIHGRGERDIVKSRDYGRGFTRDETEFAHYAGSINKEAIYEKLNSTFAKKKGRISNFEKETVKSVPPIFNISEAKRATAQA